MFNHINKGGLELSISFTLLLYNNFVTDDACNNSEQQLLSSIKYPFYTRIPEDKI